MGRPRLLAARGEKFYEEKDKTKKTCTWAGPCGGRTRGECGRVDGTTRHKRGIGGSLPYSALLLRPTEFRAVVKSPKPIRSTEEFSLWRRPDWQALIKNDRCLTNSFGLLIEGNFKLSMLCYEFDIKFIEKLQTYMKQYINIQQNQEPIAVMKSQRACASFSRRGYLNFKQGERTMCKTATYEGYANSTPPPPHTHFEHIICLFWSVWRAPQGHASGPCPSGMGRGTQRPYGSAHPFIFHFQIGRAHV